MGGIVSAANKLRWLNENIVSVTIATLTVLGIIFLIIVVTQPIEIGYWTIGGRTIYK